MLMSQHIIKQQEEVYHFQSMIIKYKSFSHLLQQRYTILRRMHTHDSENENFTFSFKLNFRSSHQMPEENTQFIGVCTHGLMKIS